MALEADLFACLGSLVGGRVFPDIAPIGTQRPYITYQQVGGDAVSYDDAALPDIGNALVQINVWADNRLSAVMVARLAESALISCASFVARPTGAFVSRVQEDIEPVLYGTLQDFSIWCQRS